MTSSNNPDALSQDGDLPFGQPGPNFDDTPEGFEPSSLVNQGPPPVRLREHDRGLHRRTRPGVRLPRLPGAGG